MTALLGGCAASRPVDEIRASADEFYEQGAYAEAAHHHAQIVQRYPGDPHSPPWPEESPARSSTWNVERFKGVASLVMSTKKAICGAGRSPFGPGLQ